MTWDEVIKNALWLYYNRGNITYCLGCSGEVAGRDDIVRRQFTYYAGDNSQRDNIIDGTPGALDSDTPVQIWTKWLAANRGKMCFDCSGFLDHITGHAGKHLWSSWSFGDMPIAGTPSSGPAGGALFKPGHVGLDIGYGYMLEICNYGRTLELNKISLRDFRTSHYITGVDYTGSDGR